MGNSTQVDFDRQRCYRSLLLFQVIMGHFNPGYSQYNSRRNSEVDVPACTGPHLDCLYYSCNLGAGDGFQDIASEDTQ
jgi:hypothetical protein